MRAKYLAIGAVALMPLAAVNCGSHDVDVGGRDGGPANVVNMPNHFSSVASNCDRYGNRVYVADHGDSRNGGGGIYVVPGDCRR